MTELPPAALKTTLADPLLSNVVSATVTLTDWPDVSVPEGGVTVT